MSREQTCKKFRTYWRKSQEVSEQIRLTVTHFLILNWQKKVKRQGWDCIFQKKKKGLKSSELFYLLFCGCNCIFFLLYLSPSRSKLQQETSNQRAFFSSKGKTTLLFVAFRLLVSVVQKKRRSFSKRLKGTALVNVEDIFSKDNANVEDIFSSPFFSWDFPVKSG